MTKIEWTEDTWNPVVGCSIVSPGCTNCYAMRMAARLEAMDVPHYAGTTARSKAGAVWTGKVALAPDKILTAPLRRRKPTLWFVNSMGDLFHEDVPDEWIDRVFAVMALTPHHTYQVLTKRSARMRAYVSALERRRATGETMFAPDIVGHCEGLAAILRHGWPLPNVWLGVSAERQQEADARIPDLLATPAAVRFVSAEPLLGMIDFGFVGDAKGNDGEFRYDALTGRALPWGGVIGGTGVWLTNPDKVQPCGRLDWVIVGGESGPGARPMHPDWARSIRDQCAAADVPFFFKQWGEWLPSNDDVGFADGAEWAARHFPGRRTEQHSSGHTFVAVGKARAGRLLDGRTHDAMPTPAQREVAA